MKIKAIIFLFLVTIFNISYSMDGGNNFGNYNNDQEEIIDMFNLGEATGSSIEGTGASDEVTGSGEDIGSHIDTGLDANYSPGVYNSLTGDQTNISQAMGGIDGNDELDDSDLYQRLGINSQQNPISFNYEFASDQLQVDNQLQESNLHGQEGGNFLNMPINKASNFNGLSEEGTGIFLQEEPKPVSIEMELGVDNLGDVNKNYKAANKEKYKIGTILGSWPKKKGAGIKTGQLFKECKLVELINDVGWKCSECADNKIYKQRKNRNECGSDINEHFAIFHGIRLKGAYDINARSYDIVVFFDKFVSNEKLKSILKRNHFIEKQKNGSYKCSCEGCEKSFDKGEFLNLILRRHFCVGHMADISRDRLSQLNDIKKPKIINRETKNLKNTENSEVSSESQKDKLIRDKHVKQSASYPNFFNCSYCEKFLTMNEAKDHLEETHLVDLEKHFSEQNFDQLKEVKDGVRPDKNNNVGVNSGDDLFGADSMALILAINNMVNGGQTGGVSQKEISQSMNIGAGQDKGLDSFSSMGATNVGLNNNLLPHENNGLMEKMENKEKKSKQIKKRKREEEGRESNISSEGPLGSENEVETQNDIARYCAQRVYNGRYYVTLKPGKGWFCNVCEKQYITMHDKIRDHFIVVHSIEITKGDEGTFYEKNKVFGSFKEYLSNGYIVSLGVGSKMCCLCGKVLGSDNNARRHVISCHGAETIKKLDDLDDNDICALKKLTRCNKHEGGCNFKGKGKALIEHVKIHVAEKKEKKKKSLTINSLDNNFAGKTDKSEEQPESKRKKLD